MPTETALEELVRTGEWPATPPRRDFLPPPRPSWQRAGLIAGLVAGAVLSVFMTALSLLQGQDIWVGAKAAGLPFLGEAALHPGFTLGPVVVGVLSHFAVSIAWALPFAWLVRHQRPGTTVLLGAAWGIVVWLGMFYVILPLVGAAALAQTVPPARAVLEHALFGLALGLALLPQLQGGRS